MADELTIRPAVRDDARFFWEVNNDPSVRAQSINTANIPWDVHEAWFASSIENQARRMFVLELGAERVGVVRFDLADGGATISVALASAFRGQGYGRQAIMDACEVISRDRSVRQVEALVRPDNTASRGAFARAGFREIEAATERDGVVLDRMIWEPER